MSTGQFDVGVAQTIFTLMCAEFESGNGLVVPDLKIGWAGQGSSVVVDRSGRSNDSFPFPDLVVRVRDVEGFEASWNVIKLFLPEPFPMPVEILARDIARAIDPRNKKRAVEAVKPKYEWVNILSPTFDLKDGSKCERLESIRLANRIDNGSFAYIVSRCPAGRRRVYDNVIQQLRMRKDVSWTPRKQCAAVFAFAVGSLEADINSGKLTGFSKRDLDAIVRDERVGQVFASMWDTINYCLDLENRCGVMLSRSGVVAEVDAVLGGELDNESKYSVT